MASVRPILRCISQVTSGACCLPRMPIVWGHAAGLRLRVFIGRLLQQFKVRKVAHVGLSDALVPASVEAAHLTDLHRQLLAGDGSNVGRVLREMSIKCSQMPVRSGATSDAELLNQTLVLLMDQPDDRQDECLDTAVELVAEFRKVSLVCVPAIHLLAIKLAEAGRNDVRSLRLYREFLASSGVAPENELYRRVSDVYEQMMNPAAPGKARRRKRSRE